MFADRAVLYTSARLSVCTALLEDTRHLHETVLSNPEVMRLAFAGKALSFEESEQFCIEKLDYAASGKKPGVLVEKATNEIIGIAGLLACDEEGAVDFEIGFLLSPSAWGKGYATEIGHAQLDFGFSQLGCQRLFAKVSPQNRASIAVLEKLGMSWHSTLETQDRGQRHLYCKQRK